MPGLMPDIAGMTDAQFERISRMVKNLCGINLHDGKKELVKARLGKRVRQNGYRTFDEYIDFVESDKTRNELTSMLDAISTNLTFFFREPSHFDYLRETILPEIAASQRGAGRLRIWSAGCSSGEEPYTMAITCNEAIPNIKRWDAKILATDLSTKVLGIAKAGVYDQARFKDVPGQIIQRYFDCIESKAPKQYRAKPDIRNLIHFGRLNLMEKWPMTGPFDVIFCRNVMIYFDKETQARLVDRYWQLLKPRGVLFIGHSESLTSVRHRFKYVRPTIYMKK
jgi:chemotaxis protein methyltransferase CheR